jgi:hypothetical protein
MVIGFTSKLFSCPNNWHDFVQLCLYYCVRFVFSEGKPLDAEVARPVLWPRRDDTPIPAPY